MYELRPVISCKLFLLNFVPIISLAFLCREGHTQMAGWGPVHTMLEKFKSGGFSLKTHQVFSVHTTSDKFKSATITCHFGFATEEISGAEITYRDCILFEKFCYHNVLHFHENAIPGLLNSSRLKSVFTKSPFSWRISVDPSSHRRNKIAF